MRERNDPGPCPECCGTLERVYLTRREDAKRFQPIVIHESADGEFSFPMHPNAPVPPGMIRRELTNFAEADAVLKRANARERLEAEAHAFERSEQLNYMERVNRSELRDRMRHMSPHMRAFAELAMRVNDAKPRPRAVDPHIFLEVRDFDRSNREAYRDQHTDWKRRQG